MFNRQLLLDQAVEDRVEHFIRRQAIVVALVGAQFGAGRLADHPLRHHRAGGTKAFAQRRNMFVAPTAQVEHRRLIGVLQHRIAARHIAIDGGIADRHLALVAGGQQHVAELVAERHQRHAPDARLDILFGQVALPLGKYIAQHRVERADRRFDGDAVITHAQQPRAGDGIVQALLAGEARGHHHAPYPVRPQRIDRDGGGQRAIDPARQAQHDAGKTVAVHIVAQAQHHRIIDVGGPVIQDMAIAGQADPLPRLLLPCRQHQRFVPIGHLMRDRQIGIHHEGRAVEHQLILPADAVEIGERQIRLAHPRPRDAIGAAVILVDLIGAAIGADQYVRALRLQMRGDEGEPDILADRHADLHALEVDGRGQRAGREQALFIERAIIGQFALLADGGDCPAF